MSSQERPQPPGVGDLLGVAAIGRTVERVADSALSGVEAVLGRVCLPAVEEFGLAMRDKVGAWRQRNAVDTVERARPRLEAAAAEGRHAPPRLVVETLNQASWTDDADVQEMWAGLLVSSCTDDGRDDSNLIFINLLAQLTPLQGVVFRDVCERGEKAVMPNGLITAGRIEYACQELNALTHCRDIHRVDRELDHLRTLGLLNGGFDWGLDGSDEGGSAPEPKASLGPTALGLNLYVRAQGSLANPVDYFAVTVIADQAFLRRGII